MSKPERPHRPLIRIRGAWPALVILVVVIAAAALRIAGEVSGPPPAAATPTPTPTPTPAAAAGAVARSLSAVQRAYLVPDGRSWLLSFSDGSDPMPALAGSE